jgi:peroxiredoxin
MFASRQPDLAMLDAYQSQTGQTLAALAADRPLLLVFLRHFGCGFCREAVAELVEKRPHIEAQGTQIAFVHLGTEEKAKVFFKPYGLVDVPRFSDPTGALYQAFGLVRGGFRQLFHPESIARAVAAWFHGHSTGLPAGDIERMPGAFLLKFGEVRKAFRHKLISDRPDYLALATSE